MRPIDLILGKLQSVSRSGRGWKALCPAHDDKNPSLSVSEGQGSKVLLNCFAGCKIDQIVAALGLKTSDLHLPDSQYPEQVGGHRRRKAASGINVADLAREKSIPEEFLRSLGVTESARFRGAVEIPYLMADGSVAPRTRIRSDLKASKGSTWSTKPAGPIVPYGLWRLEDARQAGRVIIVEGESDCWTLWLHGFPALGIPGADMVKVLDPAVLAGIKAVFVVQEPDKGGAHFALAIRSHLRRIASPLRTYVISTPLGAKDPSDLHKTAPAAFKALIEAQLVAAPMREGDGVAAGYARPKVVIKNAQLRVVAAESYAALITSNEPPVVFQRGGRLVQIVAGERARPSIRMMSEAEMTARLTLSADFLSSAEPDKERAVFPPAAVANNLLSRSTYPNVPKLDGIIEAPTLRPDGSVLSAPGYDPQTGLFLVATAESPSGHVPVPPGPDELAAAVSLAREIVQDFPFKDHCSEANAIGLLLTALLRPAIGGRTPLALIHAPQPGTGKSLLAEVVAMIATGRGAAMMTAPTDEDEWRKKITTQLLAGPPLIVIDNVVRRLDSAQLCTALTASEWRDRALGTNIELVLPQQATWIATGNNILTGTDLARRSYWIRLDAKTSRPWARDGFRHPKLLEWIQQNRDKIIAALLTLARSWFAAGKPPAAAAKLGGFDEWCAIIAGILGHAGIEGFLGNQEELHALSDEESAQWHGFLVALHSEFGDGCFRIAELVGLINGKGGPITESLPDNLAEVYTSGRGSLQHRLGRAFSERVDRRFGGGRQYFLERAGEDGHSKVARWRVTVEPCAANPATLSRAVTNSSRDGAGYAGSIDRPHGLATPANPAAHGQTSDSEGISSAGFDPPSAATPDVPWSETEGDSVEF